MNPNLSERLEAALADMASTSFGEIEVISDDFEDIFGGCSTMACGSFKPS